MNAVRIIAIIGLACSMVVGGDSGVPGGYSPVSPDDKVNVDLCRAKIIADLESKESKANCYKVTATPLESTVYRQVVNGLNYKFQMKVIFNTTCAPNSNCCFKKGGETKTCTATVHKSFNSNDRLTYLPNQEPKCS